MSASMHAFFVRRTIQEDARGKIHAKESSGKLISPS